MPNLVLRSLLAPILFVLLISTGVNADQERPTGRWWRNSQVAKHLQLTDSEINRLEEAFQASRLKMIELKSKVEAEQFKLESLVDKPEIDESAIRKQHRNLETARSALAEEQLNFYVHVRKIIGYDRFKKFQNLRPAKRR